MYKLQVLVGRHASLFRSLNLRRTKERTRRDATARKIRVLCCQQQVWVDDELFAGCEQIRLVDRSSRLPSETSRQ
jgi:hypothetical protein